MSRYRILAPASGALVSIASWFCTSAIAQTPDWHHVALGELREVCVLEGASSGDVEVWTAEDGGRIRHGVRTSGTTTWTMQTTPDGVRQRLLDVFFLPDRQTGFACGADGVVLSTTNGGSTWTQQSVVYELDGTTPALLWGVHFFDASFGVLAGDEVFRYTTDGGTSWTNVIVNTGGGGHYQIVEYYAYDFVLDGSGDPLHGVVVADPPAILHTTDAIHWAPATILDLSSSPATFDPDFELWDVCFATDGTDPDAKFGVAVGGLQGGSARVFVTNDSGLNWQEEATNNVPATPLYGAFAWDGGNAVACGYSATIARRNPGVNPPVWNRVHGAAAAQPCVPNGNFSAPIVGADGTDGGELWFAGTFGYLGSIVAPGSATASISPTHATPQDRALWRTGATAWRDVSTGYAGAQNGVGKTTNGGVDWTMDACTTGQTTAASIALGSTGRGVFVGVPKTGSDPSAWYLDAVGTWTASSLTGTLLNDVKWQTGSRYYAVGLSSTVFLSTDEGASFSSAGTCDDGSLSGAPNLKAIALYSSTIALVCGTEGSPAQGVVYATSNLTSSTPTWSLITVTDPGPELRDIAARGTLPTIEVYTVGVEGVVLKYNRVANQFEPVTAVHRASSVTLNAVALPSSSSEVFVGGQFGRLLRYDGSSWATMKCETSKAIHDFWFDGASLGYAACADGSETADASLGIIGDGCIVRWN